MSQSNEPAAREGPASEAASSAGRDDRRAIEHHARRGSLGVRAVETIEHDAHKAWVALKKRPSLGVLVLGGLAVAAADAVGVGELAMGIAVGYGAYRLFRAREGTPTGETSPAGEHVEHG
jgi:hypothetical protein